MSLNKAQIKELKLAVQKEYEIKLKELNNEKQRKLDAIEVVAGLMEQDPSIKEGLFKSDFEQEKPQKVVIDTVTPKTPSALIRITISNTLEEFTKNTIKKQIQETHPDVEFSRHSFHTVTRSMEKAGKLIKIKQGKGKSPSVFKLITELEETADKQETN